MTDTRSVAYPPCRSSDYPSESSAPLESLADELLVHILSLLGPKDLTHTSLVSKKFYQICEEPCLWKQFCLELYPFILGRSIASFHSRYTVLIRLALNFKKNRYITTVDPSYPGQSLFAGVSAQFLCLIQKSGEVFIYEPHENKKYELLTPGLKKLRRLLHLTEKVYSEYIDNPNCETLGPYLAKMEKIGQSVKIRQYAYVLQALKCIKSQKLTEIDENAAAGVTKSSQQSIKLCLSNIKEACKYQYHERAICHGLQSDVPPLFAACDDFFAIAYQTGKVVIWDRKAENYLLAPFFFAETPASLFFLGSRLCIFLKQREQIVIWDAVKQMAPLLFEPLQNIAFLKKIDEKILLLATHHGEAVFFDSETSSKTHHFHLERNIGDICFDPRQNLLAVYTGIPDNKDHAELLLYDLKGEVLHSIKNLSVPFCRSISFDNGHIWLYTTLGGVIKLDAATSCLDTVISPQKNIPEFHWLDHILFGYSPTEGMQKIDFNTVP